jgi:outer membrane protein, heavy metal efflux system
MIKLLHVKCILLVLSVIHTQFSFADDMQHEDELIVNKALTLHDLVEKSLPHYPNSQLLAAKKRDLEARQMQAKGFLPGSAAVILRNQNDVLLSNNGETEWEAGIDMPIWLSGQRAARAAIADVSAANLNQDQQLLHLQLAGMVRDALWDIELMQGLADVADLKWSAAKQLEQDVQKRVNLGDMAQKDLLIVQAETFLAESENIFAQAEVQHAKFRYINLTGLREIPSVYTEQKSSKLDVDETHPVLIEANGKITLSEQMLNLARIETRENPSLTIGTRSLRGANDTQYNNSLGVTVRIPLQSQARNAPLLAAAEMHFSEQQVNFSQLKIVLAAAMHEAEHNLEIGELQLNLLKRQQLVAQQSLETARKGFKLGELDLIDVIRAQTQAFNVDKNLKNQQIQKQWNTARYNQAVGELP